MKRAWLAWILWWCIYQPAQCQLLNRMASFHFGEENGLIASDIYGVTQDKDGYIWIGTNEGVFRFDGMSFDHYSANEGIPRVLITRIYAFDDGDIIAIGERPSSGYLIRENQPHFIHNGQRLFLNGLKIVAEGDTVWSISPRAGVVLAVVDSQAVDSIRLPVHQPNGRLLLAMTKHRGRIYGVPAVPGYRVSQGDSFVSKTIPVAPQERLFVLSEDPKGNLWALGEQHIFKHVDEEGWIQMAEHTIGRGNSEVKHVTWDWEGRMWIAGIYQRLYVYSERTGDVVPVDEELGIKRQQVTYLFSDRDQNIWVSTAGYGLIYVRKSAFRNYGLKDGLSSEYILSIHKIKDQLWVATNSGLNTARADSAGRLSEWGYMKNSQYVSDIMGTPSGELFYATSLDKRVTNSSKYVPGNDTLPHWVWGRRLGQPSEDSLWVGSWEMVFLLVRQPDQTWKAVKKYTFRGRATDWISYCGNWYLLANQALFRVDANELTPVEISINADPTLRYRGAVAYEGAIWIVSSHGLIRWTPEHCRQYTVEDGLPSIHCSSVELDTAAGLWIGTNKGLCLMAGDRFRIFQRSSGLPSEDIRTLFYDSIHHHLWIGTPAGLSQLSLADIPPSGRASFPLYVKALEVIGDTVITGEEASLRETQNHVRLHFSSINYTGPTEVHYQYRLSGLQAKWTQTKKNTAEYLALAPGDYTFQVRSRSPGNDWGPIANMRFSIRLPFWRRWYFLLGVLFVVAIGFAWVSRWNVQRVRGMELQKRRTLSTINRLEQQALQANMNPHFIFNTLNSIQHYMGKYKDPEAMDFVADFATLVRQNMESARHKTISLKQELDRLKRYLRLEALRLDGRLRFEIYTDPHLALEECEIPAMLVQPFVENAIWHGIAPKEGIGSVKLRLSLQTDGRLCIVIEDNGIGLSASKESQPKGHISRGVQLTRQRLKVLSERNTLKLEELRDESGYVAGTRVNMFVELV